MSSDVSIVAILAAYNEADIIDQVVRDLIAQGIDVYFLDDGSTDSTAAIVERYVGRGVLAIERLPAPDGAGDATFAWERIILRKAELATRLDASWFIHHDADEFRESPWPQLTLSEAIRRVDALGYNAIDFASLDFWPVRDALGPDEDVRDALRFYSEAAPYDRIQIRAWKKTRDLDLIASGGHDATFPGRRVFPLRFLLRHYPIRGQAHGERKVFRERRNRFPERERARGWHVQYNELHEGDSFVRDPSSLTLYDPDAVRIALTLRHRGVEALEAAVETRDRDLESCRSTLQEARADLRDRNAEVRARSAEVDELRATLDKVQGALASETRRLEAARIELEGRQAELAACALEISGLHEALERRATDVAHLQRAVEDATRRLDEFHRSLSWRWTAPARAAYRMLGGR